MATPSAPALPRTLHRRAGQVRDLLAGLDGEGVVVDDGQSGHGPVSGRCWCSRQPDRPLALDRLHEIADRGLWRHPVHRHCRGPLHRRAGQAETFSLVLMVKVWSSTTAKGSWSHACRCCRWKGVALDRLHEIADRGLWRHPVHRHCRGPLHRRAGQVETFSLVLMVKVWSSTTARRPVMVLM